MSNKQQQSQQSSTTTTTTIRKQRIIFFDLDDTLYSKECAPDIYARINQYMSDELNMEGDVDAKGYELYMQFGSTLRGLIHEGYNVDPHEFYQYIHMALHNRVQRNDDRLIHLLSRIKSLSISSSSSSLERLSTTTTTTTTNTIESNHNHQVSLYVFTNGERAHAEGVLHHLGIRHLFDGIVSIDETGDTHKPHPHSFRIAMKMAGLVVDENEHATTNENNNNNSRRTEIYFVDDNRENIRAAIQMGWKGIWINEHAQQTHSHEHEQQQQQQQLISCASVHDLIHTCPELFHDHQ